MDDEPTNCAHCNKPVFPEQGYNGATGNHWDCESALRASLEKYKPRARPGDGPLANRVKREVDRLLRSEGFSDVSDIELWVQPPSHRGPRWDLACWGGTATCDGRQVSFHSWATMSAVLKRKEDMYISRDGSLSYDIG